jgi:1,4-alpha-glucan branching enzyme
MKKSASPENKSTQSTDARGPASSGSGKRSLKRSARLDTAPNSPTGPAANAGYSDIQKACLEFFHPLAREVFVAGSFNEWNPGATPLAAQGGGKWSAELALAPGAYEYRFVVDGEWTDDPKCPRNIANPFGSFNSVLEVGPAT